MQCYAWGPEMELEQQRKMMFVFRDILAIVLNNLNR